VELRDWIARQLVRYRELIDEREQRIFADELPGDIAEHLYDRVHAAHAWVEEANDTTRQCATSSGMHVHLQFVQREADQPGVRRALTLLRKNPAALSDAEREVLLHLPLLAAAAALYNSGHEHAPRLIALDKAFNKVDTKWERGLLDVIVRLDLDFLLTAMTCGARTPRSWAWRSTTSSATTGTSVSWRCTTGAGTGGAGP
jgi:hypothetical protein